MPQIVGIIGVKDLARALTAAGMDVMSVAAFGNDVRPMRQRIDSGEACPILVADSEEPGLRSFLEGLARRNKIPVAVLSATAEPKLHSAINTVVTVHLPARVEEILETVGLEPVEERFAHLVVEVDLSITRATALPEPLPEPVSDINVPEPWDDEPQPTVATTSPLQLQDDEIECWTCHRERPVEANFCPWCGSPSIVEPTAPEPVAPPVRPQPPAPAVVAEPDPWDEPPAATTEPATEPWDEPPTPEPVAPPVRPQPPAPAVVAEPVQQVAMPAATDPWGDPVLTDGQRALPASPASPAPPPPQQAVIDPPPQQSPWEPTTAPPPPQQSPPQGSPSGVFGSAGPAAAFRPSGASHNLGQVVINMAAKGGVGKSTMSMLLAERAADLVGMRVVLVDANRGQGDVSTYLRVKDALVRGDLPTVYNVAVGTDPTKVIVAPDQINAARHAQLQHLHFAAAFAPTDAHADPKVVTTEIYAETVLAARQIADLVIVDTQILESYDTSGLFDGLIAPLLATDGWALATSDLSGPSVDNLYSRLSELIMKGVPKDRILWAMNRVNVSAAFDLAGLQDRFSVVSVPIGSILNNDDLAAGMLVGRIDHANPAVSVVLDAALYRITGNEAFNNQQVPPRVKRRHFWGKNK